ncbi:AraC family transcriptional regulator, partial [Megasphaera massiliensis]|nr:AraC family transcriptional regulator [Megasphaera massiliensis]
KIINHTQMNYGVYALFLKQTKSCDLKYGRRSYDYQEGPIVCFAPGQTVRVDMIEDEITPEVYGIVFHPDLIR